MEFIDTKGQPYYASNTTITHDWVIDKAVDQDRLQIALLFRDRLISYDDFRPFASKITSTSIVLRAFYVHMWRPREYPILDRRVWRVFCVESGQAVHKYTMPRSWLDYEAYTGFFRDLVRRTGLPWRIVDKGLWVIGDRLKESVPTRKIRRFKDKKLISRSDAQRQINPIPQNLLDRACQTIGEKAESVPFRERGIAITRELIKTTMELLNSEPTKTLPQNCRNDVRERTPDGLDRRIKQSLNTDLRTANIISDVLARAGVVRIVQVRNPQTRREVKGTRLLREWTW